MENTLARELLAAEYEAVGMKDAAHYTIIDRGIPYSNHTGPALRAIEKALNTRLEGEVERAILRDFVKSITDDDRCSGKSLYINHADLVSLRDRALAALTSSTPSRDRDNG